MVPVSWFKYRPLNNYGGKTKLTEKGLFSSFRRKSQQQKMKGGAHKIRTEVSCPNSVGMVPVSWLVPKALINIARKKASFQRESVRSGVNNKREKAVLTKFEVT